MALLKARPGWGRGAWGKPQLASKPAHRQTSPAAGLRPRPLPGPAGAPGSGTGSCPTWGSTAWRHTGGPLGFPHCVFSQPAGCSGAQPGQTVGSGHLWVSAVVLKRRLGPAGVGGGFPSQVFWAQEDSTPSYRV